jgi:hypothetical protein
MHAIVSGRPVIEKLVSLSPHTHTPTHTHTHTVGVRALVRKLRMKIRIDQYHQCLAKSMDAFDVGQQGPTG